jgi:hypothetical protein
MLLQIVGLRRGIEDINGEADGFDCVAAEGGGEVARNLPQ